MTLSSRLALAAFLLASSVFADDRPACNSKLVGHFWPEQANTDRVAMEAFVHSGDLQVCARTPARSYRWQPLTVNFSDLQNKAASKAARESWKANKMKSGE